MNKNMLNRYALAATVVAALAVGNSALVTPATAQVGSYYDYAPGYVSGPGLYDYAPGYGAGAALYDYAPGYGAGAALYDYAPAYGAGAALYNYAPGNALPWGSIIANSNHSVHFVAGEAAISYLYGKNYGFCGYSIIGC